MGREAFVPPSVPGDGEAVLAALENAQLCVERGEWGQAVEWVQRAASEARKQWRPERAGELSRQAARLAGQSSSPPPVTEEKPREHWIKMEEKTHTFESAEVDEFEDKTIVDEFPQSLGVPEVMSGELAPSSEMQSTGRVALRKREDGSWQARPLAAGERLAPGEEEAVLVRPDAEEAVRQG